MWEGSEGDLIKDHTLPAEFAPFYPKGFFCIQYLTFSQPRFWLIGDININKYYYHYYYYYYYYHHYKYYQMLCEEKGRWPSGNCE